MKRLLLLPLLASVLNAAPSLADPTPQDTQSPLHRTYKLGEQLEYLMTGHNRAGSELREYSGKITTTVEQDALGAFFETAQWTSFTYNGQVIAFDPGTSAFRQRFSLDTQFNMGQEYSTLAAAEGQIDRRLRAPADDLFNFYVDVWFATMGRDALKQSGDHFYYHPANPNTFSVGQGQNCLDYEAILQSVDVQTGTAIVVVKHLPPPTPCGIRLPAEWMQTPIVPGIPNNFTEIEPMADGTYDIIVGNETLTTQATIDLGTGKILSATLTDVFEHVQRNCADASASNCKDPIRLHQKRDVSITLTSSK